MKNFIIIISFALVSCGTQTKYKLDQNEPIVDYNQSYEYYNQQRNLDGAIQRYNDQTVIMFNGREITYDRLQHLVKKEKIKSIENISDRDKITQLGYSHDRVKRIIFTDR